MNNAFVLAELQSDGTTVRARISHRTPVPQVPYETLTKRWEYTGERHFDIEGWQQTANEAGLLLEREFEGPWALGTAVRLLEQLRRGLGHFRSEERPDRQAIEGYPLRCSLNGILYDSFEAMCAVFEGGPTADYRVGEFELSQSELVVTDPGYYLAMDAHVQVTVTAKPGRWVSSVRLGPAHMRTFVFAVQVSHADGSDEFRDWRKLEKLEAWAGIDTGQCGVFDRARYPVVDMGLEDSEQERAFYERCCAITQDRTGPGCDVVRHLGHAVGVVSDTGGDGGASVYVERNAGGQVILAQLVFLGDEQCSLGESDD